MLALYTILFLYLLYFVYTFQNIYLSSVLYFLFILLREVLKRNSKKIPKDKTKQNIYLLRKLSNFSYLEHKSIS